MSTLAPLYLIYRSYFAFLSRPLRNPSGRNVSALFGFARTLVSLLEEGAPRREAKPEKPQRLAAVFDSRVPTFRHKMYSEYKATRQKAPEDLHEQVPLVEEVLAALGVPSLQVDGYEADDIIAALAEKCRAQGRGCYILSSDKDLLQLVGEGIWELRPMKSQKNDTSSGGLPYEVVGSAEVKAEWGVSPKGILDLLALTGDASDNVPGVKGVGEKTAVKLMTRYGSLDEIYANIAGIEGAVGKKLAQGKESAYFSRSLIALDYNTPLPINDIDELSVETLNRPAAAAILLREGIRQSAYALDPAAKAAAKEADAPRAGPLVRTDEAPAPVEGLDNSPADPSLLGPGTYKVLASLGELEKVLLAGREQGFIALDFETNSLDAWNSRPLGFSLALKAREGFYAPLAAHQETAPFIEPQEARKLLIPLFGDPAMTIVAHNAKYDYEVSRAWGIPPWKCKIWDTMVAAWVWDPERNNYSLDSLAAFFFNYTAVAYKDIVPKNETFQSVSLEQAVSYSGEDADLSLRVKRHLEGKLCKSGSLELFENLEMPLLPILAEMEGAGIKIEPPRLQDYGKELFVELNKIQDETYRVVGHEFNLGSPKQLQEVLFVERGLKPGKKTKTGYSTDVEVLEELAKEDRVPELILRHRTLSKLKSTYVDALTQIADSQSRLHTTFVQTGTATGRLSSRDPNLQNIPIRDEEGRRIREAFIAEPGNLLISADYSQIELVVLAHLSEDENLVRAFREGKDVHARTAALIFGLDEKDVDGARRRIAKTINFGVMYGMSAFRLANELGISRTDAARFIEAYYKTYAGIRWFIDGLIQKTEETGYASTLLGRRRYISGINSRNRVEKAAAERIAVNTPIQGSAADIVKTAMLNLDRRLKTEKSPARLLLQVHDELILECPQGETPAAAKLVQEVMENAVSLKIPLRVSVETGKCWGDFH